MGLGELVTWSYGTEGKSLKLALLLRISPREDHSALFQKDGYFKQGVQNDGHGDGN